MANNLGIGIKVKASTDQATSRVNRLSNATAKATGNFKSHQVALHKSSARMIQLSKDANRTSDSLLHLSNNSNKLTNALKFGAGVTSLVFLGRAISGFVAEHTNMAMSAIETNNLFAVSFGKMAEEVEGKIRQISQATGLNETAMKNISGTYNMLARSMGFNSEQAGTLSMNVMKLGYDLSSLTNVPIDQVMQDLRSGLIGQSETVYKYGIDVTEAALKQEALNQGISKSVREMSQGEKMYLRQIIMLRQTGLAHGDFAKTIEQPANQLRLLQQRFATLSETIGKLFIPVLAWILPIANAVVMVLIDMVNAIGRFFGIDMETSVKKTAASAGAMSNSFKATVPKINDVGKASDRSLGRTKKNIDKTGKSADDTSKKIKKMAQALLGIDEINTLKQPDADSPDTSIGDTGIGDIGGIGGDLGDIGAGLGDIGDGLSGIFDGLPLDSFMNGMEGIKTKADEIKARIDAWIAKFKELAQKWLPAILVLVGLIGIAFLSWKIAGLIGAIINAGGVLLWLKGIIGTVSFAKIFSTAQFHNASIIFLIISGLVVAFIGLRDILTETKPKLESFLMVFGGLLLIVGGLFMIFGSVVLLPGILLAAVITLGLALWKYWDEFVAFMAKLWTEIKAGIDNFIANFILAWEETKTWVVGIWEGIKTFFVETWESIKKSFIDSWEAMKTKFGEIVEGIRLLFEEKWNAIKLYVTETIPKIINDIVTWFGELPNKIAYWLGFALGKVIKFFLDMYIEATTEVPKFIEKVKTFFGELPGKIKDKLDIAVTRVEEWISTTAQKVREGVPKIIEKIKDYFGEVAGKIKDKLANVKATIEEWVRNSIGWVKTEVPKVIAKITDFFGELPGKIKAKIDLVKGTIEKWVSDAVGWVKIEVPKVINKIVEFFGELPQKIKDKIDGLRTKLVEIGENILDGIFAGLSNIGKKINGWTDSFLQGIKNGLGIKSPSRVMRDQVGKFLGLGIEVGLRQSTKGIVSTAEDISSGISGAFTDVSMTAGVEYQLGKTTLPQLSNSNMVGSISTSTVLDGDGLVNGIQNAVFSAMVSAMTQDEKGDIILQVGNSEFGRIAINSINKVTRQEGRLLLQV